ncbi:MAG: sigma-54 interaction domain-containing protein [Desulfopila sp.]
MRSLVIQELFPDNDPADIAFLSFLDQFHEGAVITDCEGRILYFNDAQARIDDLIPEDVLGRKVSQIYRVDNDDTPIIKCVQTGRAVINYSCYYRTRLGKIVNSIHNVYPLCAKAELIGVICFVREYSLDQQNLEKIVAPSRSKDMKTFGVPGKPRPTVGFGNGTRFSFKDIIGTSPNLTQAVSTARIASDSPSSILLHGETGTGKELIAQSIHNESPRRSRQFVAINCAAIPEHLLEGILFGTTRGAFTGALNRQGLFEQADGGTLFLDEINSMPLGLQAKLLRVVQERKARRIGSLKETDLNIRIISSVNEAPNQAVNRGSLRQDLLYRLGVVIVRLPPLRERMGDLEKLIHHFLCQYNQLLQKKVNAISSGVMDLFRTYHWPGNVRELEHVIEGAVNLVGSADLIKAGHLPTTIHHTATFFPHAPARGRAIPDPADNTIPLPPPSEPIFSSASQPTACALAPLATIQAETESSAIRTALSQFQGNVTRAAKQLGVSPQLLHYKMKKHSIDRKEFLP